MKKTTSILTPHSRTANGSGPAPYGRTATRSGPAPYGRKTHAGPVPYGCKATRTGFTIVELLIVIVVIAILAAISVVAYTGIQSRAHDSRRNSDIQAYQKALALYQVDNGTFPPTATAFAYIGSASSTNADTTAFRTAIVGGGYMSHLLSDPVHIANDGSGYTYSNRNLDHPWFLGDTDPNTYAIRFLPDRRPASGARFLCATSQGIHQAGTRPGTSGGQCLEE